MSRARDIAKTGGAIYNGTLGATTPASGAVTTLSTSGLLSANAGLGVTGAATFSSNVGIGTSSPVRQASIYGASSAAISFHNSTTGSLASDGLFVGNDANLAYLYNYEATPIVFATSATERMRIDGATGNVGIGGSPSKRFHVFGPDGAGEGTPTFNANTVAVFQNNGTSADATILNIVSGSASSGFIGFGNSTDDIRQAIVANMSDDSLQLRTGNNSTALTIDNSGNVGIGVTPTEALHVSNGGLLIDSAIPNAPASGTSGFIADYYLAGTRLWSRGTATARGTFSFIQLENDGGSQQTALAIDASGNVGIGTTTPAALIHGMSGDLFLTANSTAANSGQGVFFQSTTSGWGTSAAHAAIYGKRVDASNGYLRFDTRQSGTTQEAMRIDSAGNLLVGTTSNSVYNDVSGTGIALNAGELQIAGTGTPLYLNRQGSDGTIAEFRKDGASVVGSIGNSGTTALYVGSGDTQLLFKADEDDIVPFAAGGYRDAAIDLGRSNGRFKDLHLSGTANVGGAIIAGAFRSGSFSYSSGTAAVVTIPSRSTWLFMSAPNNYGGTDNRHGAVYIIRRWTTSNSAVELAASWSNKGIFTIDSLGTVSYGSTGGGIPAAAIYWMRIA